MQGRDDVAIFWDYENCPAPSAISGYDVVNSIRSVAHTFGSVKLFKAYLELSEQYSSTKCLSLRSELQSSGVSLTDCPHNGRKNVADQMIIVDMLTYVLDKPAPATIILISGDRDFAYAASILRLRQYRVVIISLPVPGAHISLKAQASVYFDWNTEIMGKVYVDAISPVVPKSGKTEVIQSPSPRTKPIVSPETPFLPPSPVTLRTSRYEVAGESTPSCVLPGSDQGRTKGDLSYTMEGQSKETHGIQLDIPPDMGKPENFREDVSLLDHSHRPQSSGVSVNVSHSSISGEQTAIKTDSFVAPTCPETRPISLPVFGRSSSGVAVVAPGEAALLPSQERIEPAILSTSGDCNSWRYIDLQTGRPLSGGVLLGNHPSSVGTADGRGPTNVNSYGEAPQSAPAYIQTFSARSHEPTSGIGPEVRHLNEVPKNIAVTTVSSASISSASDLSKTPSPSPLALPGPHKLGANVVKPIPINPKPSLNPTKPVIESKLLPREFKLLAEKLEQHHKNGIAFPSRSEMATELMAADKTLYRRAGVERFGQYVTLAEKAGIIRTGGRAREGDAWICLRSAWRGRTS